MNTFSHLLPSNRFLSRAVRESWLVAALQDEHHNRDHDRKENFIRRFLWGKFRFELVREFQVREVEIFGPLGLDSLASKIRFAAPKSFLVAYRQDS